VAGGCIPEDGSCGEPGGVASEAAPEGAAFCGCDGGVAFLRERGNFLGVVRGVLICCGEFRLAGATVLDVVVKGL